MFESLLIPFKEKYITKSEIEIQNDQIHYFDYLPSSTTNQIVKHEYYTLFYSEKSEQADWVAYEFKKDYLKNNHFKRPYFKEDSKVKSGTADW
ncbi:hypothetical protein [Flavobacterium cellulosilyticum]|uniref:hypothetical protein n=1 Tax=Flavobacterium cellulosilyticum TaxID=2541731 RepID=UPI0026A1FB5F